MIVDKLLQFSDGQELSGAAASQEIISLEQAAPTPGMSRVLDIVVGCATDISGTLQVKLQHADEEGGTYTDVAASETYSAPEAGTKIVVKVPYKTKRYLRVYFDGSPSGTVNAQMVWGSDINDPPAEAESIAGNFTKASE